MIRNIEQETEIVSNFVWNGTGLIKLEPDINEEEEFFIINMVFPKNELPISKALKSFIVDFFNEESKGTQRMKFIMMGGGSYYNPIPTVVMEVHIKELENALSLKFIRADIDKDKQPHIGYNGIASPILWALGYALEKIQLFEFRIDDKTDKVLMPQIVLNELEKFNKECECSYREQDICIYSFQKQDIYALTLGIDPYDPDKINDEFLTELCDSLHNSLNIEFCKINKTKKVVTLFVIGDFTTKEFEDMLTDSIIDLIGNGMATNYIGEIDEDEICLAEYLENNRPVWRKINETK